MKTTLPSIFIPRILRSLRSDRSVRSASFVFFLTRAFVFAIFILVSNLTVVAPDRVYGRDPQDVRISLQRAPVAQQLRGLSIRAGGYYWSVAQNGYERQPFENTREHNWAFFPLFPLLWRMAATLTGGYLLTGLALSNILFFFALILLHKTVIAFGHDASVADRTIFYLAVFPTSFFFSFPMTESLFLLVTVGSFYAARRERWWLAALLGMLAAATRVTGVLMLPALLLLYWQTYRRWKLEANLLCLFLIPASLLAFMLHLYFVTGNALAFVGVQAAWGRHLGFFLQPLLSYFANPLLIGDRWDFYAFNVAASVLALICGLILARRREWSWSSYTLASVIVPLSTVSLQSLGRYVMIIFPVFIVLATAGKSERVDHTIRFILISLLALLTALYPALVTLALS